MIFKKRAWFRKFSKNSKTHTRIILNGFGCGLIIKILLNASWFPEMMRIPKRYGQSRIDNCPFCEKTATVKNSQGVPVCQRHRHSKLPDLKCVCGRWLELCTGKYGAYFRCINCGNINFRKALELNPQLEAEQYKKDRENEQKIEEKPKPKETTVTSAEVDFLYWQWHKNVSHAELAANCF